LQNDLKVKKQKTEIIIEPPVKYKIVPIGESDEEEIPEI